MSAQSSAKYVRCNKYPGPKGEESSILLGYFHFDICRTLDDVIKAVGCRHVAKNAPRSVWMKE